MSYICLMQNSISSFSRALDHAQHNGYSVIAVPINALELPHAGNDQTIKDKEADFTYADLVLNSEQWNHKVICILSQGIDCDSAHARVRQRSEEILRRDISWAEHLQFCGHTMLHLKSDKVVNLARIVANNIKGFVLVHVPFFNTQLSQSTWRNDIDDDRIADLNKTDTWHWWNRFRCATNFNPKLKVVLEFNAGELPEDDYIRRWLGEPVEAVIIPASLFIRNQQNYPVLPKCWQAILAHFIKCHVNMIVSTGLEDNNQKLYSEYLLNLRDKHRDVHPLINFEDVLEIPLQPLNDNLDCYTYEIFEKDPVKYKLYQEAIEAALIDRVPEEEKHEKLTIVMVLGAGRGPLVRSTLNAAANTERKVRVYIIEKNPNAIRTLTNVAKTLWHNKDVKIFSKDMREFSPPEQADILVSELLGSFGDNELSPECLDCAQKLLKCDGISIPNKSISFINPIMTMKMINALRHASKNNEISRPNLATHQSYAECGCVSMLKNIYNIGLPKALFEFQHPNFGKLDNSRYEVLKFEATLDCMINGFAGYFEAVLYKDIIISINPPTHTNAMNSWFPMFFPLKEPVNVKKGDKIEVHFWRCVSKQKVWYEWCLGSPIQTHVHNYGGVSYPIYCT